MIQSAFSLNKVLSVVVVIVFGSGAICGFAWITGNRLADIVEADVADLEVTYSNVGFGFKARVPEDYTANESYTYYSLGPGKEIPGVSFRVPTRLSTGTNLSSDSYVSVERIGRAACRPSDFLDLPATTKSDIRTLGKNQYLYAAASGAGAGNLYEEQVYVMKHNGMCYGVRFFIHSTQIANYPAGTVTAFDRDALLAQFRHLTATIRFI